MNPPGFHGMSIHKGFDHYLSVSGGQTLTLNSLEVGNMLIFY